MFARCERGLQRRGQPKREAAFLIVADAFRVAVPPARVDAVNILVAKVDHSAEISGNKAGFFFDLSRGGLGEGFPDFLRAGDRLPEAREICAFNEERLAVIGKRNDENGAGDFEAQKYRFHQGSESSRWSWRRS